MALLKERLWAVHSHPSLLKSDGSVLLYLAQQKWAICSKNQIENFQPCLNPNLLTVKSYSNTLTCKPITQTWTDAVTNLAVLRGWAIYPGVSPLCACMAGPLGAGRRGVEPLVGGAPPSPSCRYTHSQRCAMCILYVHWHSVPGHAIFEQYLINFVFNFIITFFLAHIFMKMKISQTHFCLSVLGPGSVFFVDKKWSKISWHCPFNTWYKYKIWRGDGAASGSARSVIYSLTCSAVLLRSTVICFCWSRVSWPTREPAL